MKSRTNACFQRTTFKQWNTFSVFAQPDTNTRGVRRIRDTYATRDEVEGLHNCREFSQPLKCLYQAMQTQEIFDMDIFKYALRALWGTFARLLYGAVHNLYNLTTRIHRCPQNRMSDARLQHRKVYGFFNVPQLFKGCETGPLSYSLHPRKLERLIIC